MLSHRRQCRGSRRELKGGVMELRWGIGKNLWTGIDRLQVAGVHSRIDRAAMDAGVDVGLAGNLGVEHLHLTGRERRRTGGRRGHRRGRHWVRGRLGHEIAKAVGGGRRAGTHPRVALGGGGRGLAMASRGMFDPSLVLCISKERCQPVRSSGNVLLL